MCALRVRRNIHHENPVMYQGDLFSGGPPRPERPEPERAWPGCPIFHVCSKCGLDIRTELVTDDGRIVREFRDDLGRCFRHTAGAKRYTVIG